MSDDDGATPAPRPGDEAWRRPRRRRPRELWETETEAFPGALVLRDMEHAAPDDAATVLARFAVIRCLAEAARGDVPAFMAARRQARPYIASAPDRAALRLRRVLGRRARHPRWLFRGLVAIGRHAEACGHAGSTYTFLRLGYEIALGAGQTRAALGIAERLARLAAEDDAPCAAQRWNVRAQRLRNCDDGGSFTP